MSLRKGKLQSQNNRLVKSEKKSGVEENSGLLLANGEFLDQFSPLNTESVEVALTWVKAHAFALGLTSDPDEDLLKKRDVHVHCPAGAVPKVRELL